MKNLNTIIPLFLGTCILLLAVSAPAATPPPSTAPSKTDEPFHWGVNGHPLSQESYWHVPLTNQLDLVLELGATWYRFGIGAGGYRANTARIDELVAEAEKRHLRLLPILVSKPGGRTTNATPDEIRTAAARFAREVVSRYKGRITHWELDNELDSPAMIRRGETNRVGKLWQLNWGDPEGSDTGHYHEERYARARAEIQGLHEGVKAADPAAQTIVDTAGWLHYGFVERLVKEDRVPFDVLAWHWYSEMGDMTNVQGKLDLVKFLQRYGKPLWITEFNRRDGSRNEQYQAQADYLAKTAAQLRANPLVKAFFVYELLDEPYFGDSGESYYGLVHVAKGPDGKWKVAAKKPAFAALRNVIRSN